MDTKLQQLIALAYIIIPQMILCGYLIHKYGKIKGYDMGTKIGGVFQLDKINYSFLTNSMEIDRLKTSNIVLCFVSMNCPSCEKALKELSEKYKDYSENLCIVVEGEKGEVEEWYKNKNLNFHVNFINKDVLLYDLKINRFPFVFVLDNSVVINKGPLFIENFDEYILNLNSPGLTV